MSNTVETRSVTRLTVSVIFAGCVALLSAGFLIAELFFANVVYFRFVFGSGFFLVVSAWWFVTDFRALQNQIHRKGTLQEDIKTSVLNEIVKGESRENLRSKLRSQYDANTAQQILNDAMNEYNALKMSGRLADYEYKIYFDSQKN